jgi:DNA ligase 1
MHEQTDSLPKPLKENETVLPTLYKKTSTGAIQQWTVSVHQTTEGWGEIVTVFGQADGKLQTTSDLIKTGKNIGKANETTALAQAEAETKSKWEKKLKSGYCKTIEDAASGAVDKLVEGGVLPMLAKKFWEDKEKIKWPALAQPKFDGIRCEAILVNGVCTLWSRTRKPITSVPHVAREVERCFPDQTRTLDGELYNHEYKNNFEEIVSFVRQENPKEGHEVVQYHVYDIINDMTNDDRNKWLDENLPSDNPTIKKVETVEVATEDDLLDYYQKCMMAGYEGAMVRNKDGKYVNKRSADLQKVKPCDDDEFKIVGVTEGRGKLQGHAATFICEMENGTQFEAKMRGKQERLKEYFENHDLWKGQLLTVKYQGLTAANGVPRFPVGVRLRVPE